MTEEITENNDRQEVGEEISILMSPTGVDNFKKSKDKPGAVKAMEDKVDPVGKAAKWFRHPASNVVTAIVASGLSAFIAVKAMSDDTSKSPMQLRLEAKDAIILQERTDNTKVQKALKAQIVKLEAEKVTARAEGAASAPSFELKSARLIHDSGAATLPFRPLLKMSDSKRRDIFTRACGLAAVGPASGGFIAFDDDGKKIDPKDAPDATVILISKDFAAAFNNASDAEKDKMLVAISKGIDLAEKDGLPKRDPSIASAAFRLTLASAPVPAPAAGTTAPAPVAAAPIGIKVELDHGIDGSKTGPDYDLGTINFN